MNLEKWILSLSAIITSILLWKFVPKNKILQAHLSFLFMQAQTWVFGAVVVENRLIEYPVRLLHYAYRVSLIFEYFIYPSISALFNLHFPVGKGFWHKLIYSISFPTIITIFEVILEKNTKVITYIHWSWYWSWITMFITLHISYLYYIWFFKKIRKQII